MWGVSCEQEVMAGVRATARPGMEAWRRRQAGEVEGPLILKLGLELGQSRVITRRSLLIAPECASGLGPRISTGKAIKG